jgi:hypothetical protein
MENIKSIKRTSPRGNIPDLFSNLSCKSQKDSPVLLLLPSGSTSSRMRQLSPSSTVYSKSPQMPLQGYGTEAKYIRINSFVLTPLHVKYLLHWSESFSVPITITKDSRKRSHFVPSKTDVSPALTG